MTPGNNPGAWQALKETDPVAANAVLEELRRTQFVPHLGGQQQIMASEARFRVIRAGRRWGKTQLAAHEAIIAALKAPDQMVWWVANSDKTLRRGYRALLKQLPKSLLAKPPPSDKANDRIIELVNGTRIEFYTAGSPDSLAGEGVNFLVVDEAALIHETVWYQLLRPTLTDTRGRALIISTPRGKNWFWKMWNRGQRGGDYASWHYTSYDNPYIHRDEFDDAKEQLPTILFEQEYLAEFVANAASIFSWEDRQVLDVLDEPEGHVVMGVDLAKKVDFTVLDAINAETQRPVYYERLQKTPWPEQERLIVETAQLLERQGGDGITVAIDSTGIGDVVFDHLEEAGLDVVPINFSSGTGTTRQKEKMVRLLAGDLEHGRAYIFEDAVDEFSNYEYEITENGRYKFEAAGGGHDDKVSAKLLQHWALIHEAPGDVRVMDPDTVDLDDLEDDDEESELIRPDSAADIMARPEAWA